MLRLLSDKWDFSAEIYYEDSEWESSEEVFIFGLYSPD